jgi:Holliday junction resolvase RusA-like endonuclease
MPDAIRADLTNKAESIMDLLVDAGVLQDDNWNVVPEVILRCKGIDRTNPRAEITIEKIKK